VRTEWRGRSEAAGGTASTVQQDVARPEDSEKVVNHALDAYGALHYAVNNAGIGGAQAHRPGRRIWRTGRA